MPHALSMPAPGLQAVILCGPGSSFPTFTASPDEFPKALIPIANRPMVWYPLEFCYRMGVTNITLIAPPSSAPAINAALNTNPHLTALPSPKPDLLSPADLEQTTGTAQIFRLPEVRKLVKGDFIVLPCDLVCEMGGERLLEAWVVKETGMGGTVGDGSETFESKLTAGHERAASHRPGLGVWYPVMGENKVKGEERDFIGTAPLEQTHVPPPKKSLLPAISELVYSMPMDSLNDMVEEKGFGIRHSLIRAHPRLRMSSSHRDAHLYIFPAWVMDMINANEHMDNLSEDVLGWWAKAGWQAGLGEKLQLDKILAPSNDNDGADSPTTDYTADSDVNISNLTSTATSDLTATSTALPSKFLPTQSKSLVIPPMLAYLHPSPSPAPTPFICRVDTSPLLLSVSLALAKLDSIEALGRTAASPLAHAYKIAHPAGVAAKCTVTRPDCLLAENVTVEEKCAIKECVIGANCQIRQGAKLTRCVLMDGVIVGKGVKLTGCILGRRCEVGEESVLQDCEAQDNMLIEPRTEAKNEKFMSSKGLEASEQEFEDAFADEGLEDDESALVD